MGLAVGDVLEGKVSGITKFGAFVDLPEGKTGMVHISEVAQTYVKEISDFVKIGQVVKVKVMSITPEGKIGLSMKKALPPAPKPNGGSKRQGGTQSPGRPGRCFPAGGRIFGGSKKAARFKKRSAGSAQDGGEVFLL